MDKLKYTLLAAGLSLIMSSYHPGVENSDTVKNHYSLNPDTETAQVTERSQNVKNVDFGRVECSNSALYTSGLCDCSALVIDFGQYALMTHAYPTSYRELFSKKGCQDYRDDWQSYTYADESVGKLLQSARIKSFELIKAKAYLDAGSSDDQMRILDQLKRFHIPVLYNVSHEIGTRKSPSYACRAVYFDPSKDSIRIDAEN